MESLGNRDLHTEICPECGTKSTPGEVHSDHNFGWKQKVLIWNWHKIAFDGYPGWDLIGSPDGLHPPFVMLKRRGRIDKTSTDIDREFDDIATGKFYSRDWTSDGIPFVNKGEVYHSGWWFQKKEDAAKFVEIYGGTIS